MRKEELIGLAVVLILLVLIAIIITIFYVFITRKNKLIQEQKQAERRYKDEIVKTQIEIREETLRNISWELHDNIGQLMTLAKIQVQSAKHNPEKLDDVADIIGKGLNELRTLSKSINPDAIKNLTLDQAIKMEIDRFNRLNFINASFSLIGEKRPIDAKRNTILFRILQEFFSNTIKHSKAASLDVELSYSDNKLTVTAEDDGQGFDVNNNDFSGIGLKNMTSRAQLIGADLNITSQPKQGTQLKLIYNFIT